MPQIIPIVEGDGDVDAVPLLLRRILEYNQRWDWKVGRPKRSGDYSALRRNLDSFLQRAQMEPDCGGILILLDLDDGCPQDEAYNLAIQARRLNLLSPIAIVLAHREYEAWFLASIHTIAGQYGLPSGLIYESAVEARRGAKEWLTAQMPPRARYKETVHQVKFTALIDLDLARQNSRSFRRLCHAIEELTTNVHQRGYVTP